MTIDVQEESFDSITDEWRDLAAASTAGSVFGTPAWQRAWWESCRSSEELLLLSFRTGGEAKGIAPLMRAGDTVQFIGHSDLCDYHEFLLADGTEAEFYPCLVDELITTDWRTLELDGLTEDSPTLKHLPDLARQRGLYVEQTLEEVSPKVSLPSTWEEYQGSLRKKDRHELRRKLRRLTGAGETSCYAVSDAGALTQDVSSLLELLRNSGEAKAAFLTPEREQFFHTMAAAMSQEGYLKLFFLELDGVRVAASFLFDYKDAYYLYNSGYDVNYGFLSVGLLLKALCLQDAIEQGKREFDLLRGPEGYKYDLGGKDQGVYKLVIRR